MANSSSCGLCPPGSSPVQLNSACACGIGYEKGSSGDCQPCEVGFYQDQANSDVPCTPCEAGTFGELREATASTDCTACAANSVSAPGASVCQPCGSGALADDAAAFCVCSAGSAPVGGSEEALGCAGPACACQLCGTGHYKSQPSAPGSGASQLCTACSPGQFNAQTGSTSAADCVKCTGNR